MNGLFRWPDVFTVTLVAWMALVPGGAVAQASTSTESNGITLTIIGSGSQDMRATRDGGVMSLNGVEVKVRPGEVTVAGEAIALDGPDSVTIEGSAGSIRVIADEVTIWERSAVDDLRARAEAGEVTAMGRLAMALLNGDGVDPDPQEGADWLRRAARAGDAEAASVLAFRLFRGVGVEVDRIEAREWAEVAAAGDHDPILPLIGEMLVFGLGGPAEPERGFAYLQRAAAQGDPQGNLLLGLAHGTGTGVARDPDRAAGFYRLAAEAGQVAAIRNLVVLAIESELATVDLAEAEANLALLASVDHPDLEVLRAAVDELAAAPDAPEADTERPYWVYFLDGQEVRGPLDPEALAAARADGRIGPDTLVWHEGLAEWTAFGALPGLLQ